MTLKREADACVDNLWCEVQTKQQKQQQQQRWWQWWQRLQQQQLASETLNNWNVNSCANKA